MPDLNLANPQVTAELDKITRYWLKEMGVDGFRLDAVRHYIEQGAARKTPRQPTPGCSTFSNSPKSLTRRRLAWVKYGHPPSKFWNILAMR